MAQHFPWSDTVLSNYIVYISGLPLTCTKLELMTYLRQHGEPLWMEQFKSRQSKDQYAHVMFVDWESYQNIFSMPVHNMGNSNLRICMWKKSELSQILEEIANRRKIFLKNIGPKVSETHIQKYFQQFGKIDSIEFAMNHETHRRKDIAFITFRSEESARSAQEQPVIWILDRKIKVRQYSYNIVSKDVPSPQSLTTYQPQFLWPNLIGPIAHITEGLRMIEEFKGRNIEVIRYGGENHIPKEEQAVEDNKSNALVPDTAPPPNKANDISRSKILAIDAIHGGNRQAALQPPDNKKRNDFLVQSSKSETEIKVLHFDYNLGGIHIFDTIPAETSYRPGGVSIRYFTIEGEV